MSLYTMTAEMLKLISEIEAGEIPEDAISDTREVVEAEWNDRAEAVIACIKNLRVEAEGIRAEVKNLQTRLKGKENALNRLSDYLARSMTAIGKIRYESARHQISFRTSERAEVNNDDIPALLEWARDNMPEAISPGEDRLKIEVLKEASKTVDIPYLSLKTYKNIQIK